MQALAHALNTLLEQYDAAVLAANDATADVLAERIAEIEAMLTDEQVAALLS